MFRTSLENSETRHDTLLRVFGFEAFKSGQDEVTRSISEGISALAIMPTGGGKSLCYQLPACRLPGITLVISPLIALMKDQVDSAYARGIAATCIHSGQTWQNQKLRLRGMQEGLYKIIYVAPERFKNKAFREVLDTLEVSLLAIDEAHCISQWGHDFRPDYRELRELRKSLGNPTTLALTATATPEVRKDILAQLGLDSTRIIISGFERPNLYFEIQNVRNDQDKYIYLRSFLEDRMDQSIIIYCTTRRQVNEIRVRVEHEGHLVGSYHAGLSNNERRQAQESFMAGDIPILVATNAFGMGIDKHDVRAVVHFNFPGSLESYYQEAGRAGRDGEKSHCLLFNSQSDRKTHEYFIDTSFPPPDVVQKVWAELRQLGVGTHPTGPAQITRHLEHACLPKKGISRHPSSNATSSPNTGAIPEASVYSVFRLLKLAKHLDYGWRDGFAWVALRDISRPRDLRVDWHYLNARRQCAHRQLSEMLRFMKRNTCRQLQLLQHFESTASFGLNCNFCDVCLDAPPLFETQHSRIRSPDKPSLLIRKLLSAVARTRGRHHAKTITAMVRGSKASSMRIHHLESLSTFSILDFLRPSQSMELLRLCERHRLTLRDTNNHISLTDEGVLVMRGDHDLPQALDDHLAKRICLI